MSSRRHGRRKYLVLLSVVAALFAPIMVQQASATPTGLIWGAYPGNRAGEDEQAATLRLEQDAGRKFAVVRDFLLWDDPFPTSFHTWLRDTGREPIISVRAFRTNRTVVPWADIAAATPGTPLYSDMVDWAERVKSYGGPIYFSFNHEPESAVNQPMGTPADFIAAWRTFRGVFEARGVTNAKFIWIMTDYSFFAAKTDRRWAPNWYPGDAYLDAIGADAYNWFTCRSEYKSPWKSLEQIIAPLRDFGLQHPDKEMWLAEWASVEDPAVPGRKAQWIRDAQDLFKRPDYSQFVGISYFDSYKRAECPWPIETTTSSQSAFVAMGADPFYGGDGVVPVNPISFVAAASNRGQKASHTVRIPTSVRAGDTLLLFYTAGANGTTNPPAGWTSVDGVDPDGLPSRVWSKVATAADAGSNVTVTSAVTRKADLTVVAYRNAGADPIDVEASATDLTTTTQHRAPSVTPTRPGDVVVAYWADKSASNAGHTVPGSMTKRVSSVGSSTGHVTVTVADTSNVLPGTPTGTFTATGTAAATRAAMYTIALGP
jgi:hypothetical protein